MLRRLLDLDQDFFDKPDNSSGSLTSKLTSVPNGLLELISANIMLMFIVLVNVVSSSVLAIAYGWKLGLVVVFGGMPVLLGCGLAKVSIPSCKSFPESEALLSFFLSVLGATRPTARSAVRGAFRGQCRSCYRGRDFYSYRVSADVGARHPQRIPRNDGPYSHSVDSINDRDQYVN